MIILLLKPFLNLYLQMEQTILFRPAITRLSNERHLKGLILLSFRNLSTSEPNT